jgi:hypothetical protein
MYSRVSQELSALSMPCLDTDFEQSVDLELNSPKLPAAENIHVHDAGLITDLDRRDRYSSEMHGAGLEVDMPVGTYEEESML